jgi:hypothetical protein
MSNSGRMSIPLARRSPFSRRAWLPVAYIDRCSGRRRAQQPRYRNAVRQGPGASQRAGKTIEAEQPLDAVADDKAKRAEGMQDAAAAYRNLASIASSPIRRARFTRRRPFEHRVATISGRSGLASQSHAKRRVRSLTGAVALLLYCCFGQSASAQPLWVVCHERSRSTWLHVTVREMKEGPSSSAIMSPRESSRRRCTTSGLFVLRRRHHRS